MFDFWQRFKTSFTDEINVIFKHFNYHWLLWILPMIIFFLISSIFSMGVMFDLPVGYIDHDKTPLSRQLIRNLDAGAHAKLINYESDLDSALIHLQDAKAYALLYIPPHFEADVFAGRQPSPVLYYNALYYSAGIYSISDYSGLIAELNSQYRSALANKVGLTMPTLPSVTLNYDGLFNASGNSIYYQQFSAIVHILQLFVVTITIYILGNLPKRTLPTYPFILGKLAPFTLWYTALLLFQIALLVLFSGAKVSGMPVYMLPVVFFYVIAAQSIGILLFTFTQSKITAYSLIGILVGLALTYSGTTIPTLAMPWIAQMLSKVEPLSYALNALFDIFLRQPHVGDVLLTCLILLVYPIVITLLVRRFLVRRLRRGEVEG